VRDGKGEIIVVDSGSTDRTIEIARSFGAKVFTEEWKGYAAQKNSAIDKAAGKWILSLDADEELEPALAQEIDKLLSQPPDQVAGFFLFRKNFFLKRWIKHGGFWPDPKLRLFRQGSARFEDRLVHEDAKLTAGTIGQLQHAIIHNSYPTFSDYIAHMNRYSSLGAEMTAAKGKRNFMILDIVFRPLLTFIYNYFFRFGFLDGREGFLLHVGHAIYVSWKYMKVWELQKGRNDTLASPSSVRNRGFWNR
jgi:glycosyltransferase involved in cell wall biosynthesis